MDKTFFKVIASSWFVRSSKDDTNRGDELLSTENVSHGINVLVSDRLNKIGLLWVFIRAANKIK